MIRRNSSNINPSTTDSPTYSDHLTAAEGIHIDKPVTGLNHVKDSVNFELTNENTYILRKPITFRKHNRVLTILLYDNIHEFVADSGSYKIINGENEYDVYFKCRDIDNNVVEASLKYVINTIHLDYNKYLKAFNASKVTTLQGVYISLKSLAELLGVSLFNPKLYKDGDPGHVYRYCTIYFDEDAKKWYFEMLNPEVNTFTGGDSATEFNPNITLDNPYAIRDLYKYGANSVTQILPYTSSSKSSVSENTVITCTDSITLRRTDGVFRVEYSRTEHMLYVYTRVHILSIKPTVLAADEETHALNEILTTNPGLSLNVSVNNPISEDTTKMGLEEFKFKYYIPAGALLFKIRTYDSNTVSMFEANFNSDVYLVSPKYTFLDFYKAPYFVLPKGELFEHTVNHTSTEDVFSDARQYDLDVVFEENYFKVRKSLKNIPDYKYATFSNVELTDEEAVKLLKPYTSDNINITFGANETIITKYVYFGKDVVDIGTKLPETVAELTERVDNPSYVIGQTFNENTTNEVILKAFITAQSRNDNYYCVWEYSKDEGISWDPAVEFLAKFKDQTIDIPILDMSKSNETLENADTYVKKVPMVLLSNIKSNNDLIETRPDVLQIITENTHYKYRFSVYYFKKQTTPPNVSDVHLSYAPDCTMYKYNNIYSSAHTQISSIHNASGTSNIINVKDKVMYVKYDANFGDCSLKYYVTEDEKTLDTNMQYKDITPTPLDEDEIIQDGITYKLIKFTLPDYKRTYVTTYFYKFVLFKNSDASEVAVLKFQNYISLNCETPGNEDFHTFIPNICYKAEQEVTSLDYTSTSDYPSTETNVLYTDGISNYRIKPRTDAYFRYFLKGTVYNNSNFPQPIILDEQLLTLDSDVSSEMRSDIMHLAIHPKDFGSTGSLKFGEDTIDLVFEELQTGAVTRMLPTYNKYYILKPHSSIDFELNYTLKILVNVVRDYTTPHPILRKGIVPITLKTYNETMAVSSPFLATSNVGYASLGSAPIPPKPHIITAYKYVPDLVKNVQWNNTEDVDGVGIPVTWDFPENIQFNTNIESENSTITKANLISQKEYAFTLTTSDAKTLIPKRIPLETGKVLYHNNQIFTYGVKGYENTIYISNPESYITPMFNNLDLAYGFKVTKILPWRNYLVVFTKNSIHLASYDDVLQSYVAKTVSTSVGLSEEDAETAVDILNGVLFKSGESVYRLVPNLYAATDNILNLSCISSNIEILHINKQNFAFTTNEKYYLFIPETNITTCYIYDYLKKTWTKNQYPVVFTKYDFITPTDIRLHDSLQQYYFNKTVEEAYPELFEGENEYLRNTLEYGDCLTLPYYESGNLNIQITPISFNIDFGQKSSNYSENKQFLGTRLVFQTLSEKDSFPIDVTVSTDGMLRKIHIDESTDGALLKTSLNTTSVLATYQPSKDSQIVGTLRQLMLKYSGKGKTIRHYIEGNSMYRFKFYSLDYRYRILPKK